MSVLDLRRHSDTSLTLDAPNGEPPYRSRRSLPPGITALTRATALRYLVHTWLGTVLLTALSGPLSGQRLKAGHQETALRHWFQYLHDCGVVFRPRKTIRGAFQEYLDGLSRAGLTSDDVLWLDRGEGAWAVLGRAPAARPVRPCLAASWSFPVADEPCPVREEESLVIQVTRCIYRPACRLATPSGEQPTVCARAMEFFEAVRRVAGIATESRLVHQERGVCQLDLRAKIAES